MKSYSEVHDELIQFKKECATKYQRVVAWIETQKHYEPQIKYFHPKEELLDMHIGSKLFYDATAKPEYRWKGVEISTEIAVKYNLPYMVTPIPFPMFQHPRQLHFKKAGKSVINNLHYLYDDMRDIGIGYEEPNGKRNYHKVVTRYEIIHSWKENYKPLVQQTLF